MVKLRTVGFLAAALVCLGLSDAHAQRPPCGSTEILTKTLAEKYSEHPVWKGTSALPTGGTVNHTLYLSGKGTWTLVSSVVPGISCMIGSGQNGDFVLPDPQDPAPEPQAKGASHAA